MHETTRRRFLKASGATGAALIGAGSVLGAGGEKGAESDDRDHPLTETKPGLVGTWTASPVPPVPSPEDGRSAEGFEDETLRLIVRTSVGGSSLRVRLANTFGEQPVTIGHTEVGIQDEGATVVSGSNREVSFGDRSSVTIPPGAKVYSNPVDFDVDAEQHLAVSLYLPDSTGPATHHPLGLTTSYIAAGDDAATTAGDSFETETTQWFYLKGIDVVSPDTNGAVVALGNSITDGFGSTIDANNMYPSVLAERVHDTDVIEKSVLNAGISGNRVISDPPLENAFGPNALARLDRDVIAQTGVTDVILLEGINDIGNANATAEEIIRGMKQIIARVHAKELRVFGATLTPFKRADYAGYYSAAKEAERQAVNEWIRTSGAFDGVFDFDEALRDPDNPKRLLPKYDSGDALHPSDAGYREMARTVGLDELADESEDENEAESVAPMAV
jgi:lysophospholipase L1-like esterase